MVFLTCFPDDKVNDVQNTTRIEEETHDESKSIERISKNGRIISYIMSPVPKLEPALPRRKKHPDFAYRHHEFLVSDNCDGTDYIGYDRARVNIICTQ